MPRMTAGLGPLSALLGVVLLAACFYTIPELPAWMTPPGPETRSPSAEPSPLPDEAYFTAAWGALEQVLDGLPEGPDLIAFLHERGRRARIEQGQAIAVESGFQGTHFWIVLEDPRFFKAEIPVRFDEATDVLHLQKVRLGGDLHGRLLAGELARARAHLLSTPGSKTDQAGCLFGELQARELQQAIVAARDLRPVGADTLAVPIYDLLLQDSLLQLLAIVGSGSRLHRWRILYGLLAYPNTRLDPQDHSDWLDHRPRLAGLDIQARRGREVPSPIEGLVTRIDRSLDPGFTWNGLIVRGTGRDEGIDVRILGLEPLVSAWAEVGREQTLGRVLAVPRGVRGVEAHLHLEIYRFGRRDSWAESLDDPLTDRMRLYEPREEVVTPRTGPLRQALALEEADSLAAAVTAFEAVLALPGWQVSDAVLYHHVARCLAALGRFEEAAVTQQKLIDGLELELEYAAGHLPDPRLGTISACPDEASLILQLARHRQNLAAYRRGEEGGFFYDW
jgi:hypothetical protein